jgi:opacity protein-like surface antigen
MRYGWGIVLVLAATAGIANAQERYVPVLGAVSSELGLSGAYNKSAVADTHDVTNLNIAGHIGVIAFSGIEIELESGFSRYHSTQTDSTAKNWTIAGNALINVPLLSQRLTGFALIGYGYDRSWEQREYEDPEVETVKTKSNFKFWQYGIGVKYMLVANTALRVDYRWIRPTGQEDDGPDLDRETMLIGISIFQ